MYTLKKDTVLVVLLCVVPLTGCSRSGAHSESNSDQIPTAPISSSTSGHSIELWNTKTAATYLDQRAAWWAGWSTAGRDHNTFCVSCHTTLPYVLARPVLRTELHESGPSANERTIVDNVRTRVRLWSEVAPYYNDTTYGARKGVESRATESVINALILANFDAQSGQLNDDTRIALDNMWALQKTTGDQKGSWDWQQFGLRPWEAVDSRYFGAILAAVAVGTAPSNYASLPNIQANLNLLRNYLTRDYSRQSLLNRVLVLWASTRLAGLLSPNEREATINEALSKQQADGGWRLSSVDWTWNGWGISSLIGIWKRQDWSPQETKSDGFATAVFLFALEQVGVPTENVQMSKGLSWLRRHQDSAEGYWPAYSLNKHRDPKSNVGLFMSDAATAFAVLALANTRRQE